MLLSLEHQDASLRLNKLPLLLQLRLNLVVLHVQVVHLLRQLLPMIRRVLTHWLLRHRLLLVAMLRHRARLHQLGGRMLAILRHDLGRSLRHLVDIVRHRIVQLLLTVRAHLLQLGHLLVNLTLRRLSAAGLHRLRL